MKPVNSLLIAGLAVSGCAQTPPATVAFPLTKTIAELEVARSVKCDAQFNPHVTSTVTVDVIHGADPSAVRLMDISRLDGALANTSLELKFLPDQRLSSVNAESTGQGETILRAALSLAKALVGTAQSSGEGDRPMVPTRAQIIAACKELAKRMGDQALSVSYAANVDFVDERAILPLRPVPDDAERAADFAHLLGAVCAKYERAVPPAKPIAANARASRLAMLPARQPGQATLAIAVNPDAGRCRDLTPISPILWAGVIPVGQLGTEYEIPIPRAAAFGKQTFKVTFDPSGALTELNYGKETGAGQAIAVAQAATDTVKPPTDAERTAEIEAEMALRKAQDKRAKCMADVTQC